MDKPSRLFVVLSLITILGCGHENANTNTQDQQSRPNILFILADQWRAQATGYNGDPNLVGKTHNLDRMAAQGVIFRNAISVTPVCTPYRAALMTGQYPTTTGMIFNDLHLPESAVTMAELYQDAGYHTGYIGKWHLDGMGRFAYTPPERRQGFEYWKALECSHQYNDMIYYEGTNDQPQKREGYSPYEETEDAIAYIKQQAATDEPFLMVLAWGTPHFPHDSAPEELKKEFPKNVGLVLQAYMRRTYKDLENLMDLHTEEAPLNYRLCKGIYVEPKEIAYKKYEEVNEHFIEDIEFCFKNGVYPGIATHDKPVVEGAYRLIEKYNVPKDKYEFQMLYGVTPALRQSILEDGHRMRVYVPYGKKWFGYSTRRLKENPKMASMIMKAIFVKG